MGRESGRERASPSSSLPPETLVLPRPVLGCHLLHEALSSVLSALSTRVAQSASLSGSSGVHPGRAGPVSQHGRSGLSLPLSTGMLLLTSESPTHYLERGSKITGE